MCKGNTGSTSTSMPASPAYQMYTQLLERAQGVANTPYEGYGGELVAPVNAQQQRGIDNVNGLQGNYTDAIGMARNAAQPITAEQIQQYMSPYTKNVVDATQAQFNNQNSSQLNDLRGRFASQGALGGNAIGVAQGQLTNQQQLAQAPVIAGLMNQGYTTGLNTALNQQQAGLQGAYGVANINNAAMTGAGAQIGAGTLQQGTQQAQDTAQYQQFLAEKAYPFQTTQWLSGIGTGVGSQMGGSSTSQGPTPSTGSQILGGVSAGAGLLGATGAFGSAGWLMPALAMLARGGRVKSYAGGGGVAFPDNVMPEDPEGLAAQQDQLLEGDRDAQMFPPGTPELPLPEGMERFANGRGAFHFNPKAMGVADVAGASAAGRENELLDLGPFSKEDIAGLVAKGEHPLVVVERTPDGTEVRAALGTESTVPQQLEAMEKAKSPGNRVVVEDLFSVLKQREGGQQEGIVNRDLGGPVVAPRGSREESIPGTGVGGGGVSSQPYAGGTGWVPSVGITPGQGAPRPPSVPEGDKSNLQDQLKNISGLASTLSKGFGSNSFGDPTFSDSSMGGAGLSADDDNPSPYYRGGGVGYAEGGVVPVRGEKGNSQLPSPNEVVDSRFPLAGEINAGIGSRNPRVAQAHLRYHAGRAAGGGVDEFGPTMGGSEPDTAAPLSKAFADIYGATPDVWASGLGGASPETAAKPAAPPPPPPQQRPPVAMQASVAPAAAPTGVAEAPRASTPDRNALVQETLAAAHRYGVPPQIALKLAKQESGFNPEAVSPKGAVGVTQLMPGTAQELGVDPKNPIENINGGMRYLSQQYQKYGDWPTALAAYNAGPGRMDAVIAGRAGLPAETASYVNSITGRPWSPPGGAPGASSDPSAARGVEPPAARPRGPDVDLSGNSKLWPSLMAAGFGMMSSRSPYPAIGVGEGAMAGLQTYENLKQHELQRGMSQQRINMEAARLSQSADQFEKRQGLEKLKMEQPYNGRLTTQQQMELMKPVQIGVDPNTMSPIYAVRDPKSPSGYRVLDPKELRGQQSGAPAPITPPPAQSNTSPERTAAAAPADEKPPVWEGGGGPSAVVRDYSETGGGYDMSAASAQSDKVTGDYIEKFVEDADRLYRRNVRKNWDSTALDAAKESNPAVANLAEAILEGRQPPPKALTGKYSVQNRQAMELVRQVDPNFDESYYATKNKARSNFTQGVDGRQIRRFNTTMGHIGELILLGRELDNYSSGSLGPATSMANTAVNWGREKSQDPRVKNYKVAVQAVANELEAAFKGSNPAVAGIEHWRETAANPNITQQELEGATKTMLKLLGSQVESSAAQYAAAIRAPIPSDALMTAPNREMYKRILNGQNPVILRFPTPEQAQEALKKKRLQIGDDFAGPDGTVRKLTPELAQSISGGRTAPASPAAAAPAAASETKIDPRDASALKANANNPAAKAAIDKKYGPGTADRILSGP